MVRPHTRRGRSPPRQSPPRDATAGVKRRRSHARQSDHPLLPAPPSRSALPSLKLETPPNMPGKSECPTALRLGRLCGPLLAPCGRAGGRNTVGHVLPAARG